MPLIIDTKNKLKGAWSKTFTKPSPSLLSVLTFPSLSPLSVMDQNTGSYFPVVSNSSPTPTVSSASSYYSNDGKSVVKGPRVRPYGYSYSQHNNPIQNRTKSIEVCFMCEEPIGSKFLDENIIELECGDCVHERCMDIAVNYKIESLLKSESFTPNKDLLGSLIFPSCGGYHCKQNGVSFTMKLVDTGIFEERLRRALIMSIEYDSEQIELLSTISGRHATPSLVGIFETTEAPKTASTQPLRLSLRNPQALTPKYPDLNPPKRIISRSSLQPSLKPPKRRSWSDLTTARAVSGVSMRSDSASSTISTFNNDSIMVKGHKLIPFETLQGEFLQTFLDNCDHLDLSTFVKFGNLRLVDNLLVKLQEDVCWTLLVVYLFDNYLVVQNNGIPVMYALDASEISFEHNMIKVSCAESSVLLESHTASILEKWAIGLSDFTFSFPCEFVTSTLSIKTMEQERDEKTISSIDIIFEGPSSSGDYSSTTFKQHASGFSDFESDTDVVRDIMKALDAATINPDSELDSDSDYDSDEEKIQAILC